MIDRSIGILCTTVLLSIGSLVAPIHSQWNQLRGPDGGHAVAIGAPTTWSEHHNVVWKVEVPGLGFSSPIVGADGLVWLTTAVEETESESSSPPSVTGNPRTETARSLQALAFDFSDGRLVHQIEVFRPSEWQPVHPDNSLASPTPISDDRRIYVHFGAYGTAAIDSKSGTVSWRNQDLVIKHEVGPGSSPILHHGLLIINYDGTDQQFVAALDTTDGRLAWRAPRSVDLSSASPSHRKAFSTPLVVGFNDSDQLISTAASQVNAYDPLTGQELWRARFEGYSNVPQPVSGLGMVFVTTGYIKPRLLAIRLGGEGDITNSHIAWSYHWQAPANPTPLILGDRLFMISDWGIASWLDARIGESLWRERLGGRHSASPLHILGKIYTFSVEGESIVFAAKDTYQHLATNQIDGKIRATPAVIDSSLLVRTESHLYRIANRQGPPRSP